MTVQGLSVFFGASQVLKDVDLSLVQGSVHALIGPNGAGKTTLVNAVSGVVKPRAGVVKLGDRDVTGISSARIARAGVGRTFQHPQLFPTLTPTETIAVVRASRRGAGDDALQSFMLDTVRSIVDELPDLPACRLSFGHQRLLELARAAALLPSVVFVDEPVSGLDEAERNRMRGLIADFARVSAVCLIEHDMRVVSDLASTVTVLDQGAVIATGDPSVLTNDAAVRRAYLGEQSVATS